MITEKLRIAIITNIITTYRKGFYDRLFKREDLYVRVYCQDHMPGMNLSSIHEQYPDNVKIIKFISAKREQIAWQFLPWREIIRDFDVVFIAGNPRVISDFIFGTFLRLIKKKVVFWTMAHSFRGNKITESLRLFWSRIFPVIFVYTDKEVEFLRTKGFLNQFILGMNNGLDQKKIDQAIQLWPQEKLQSWRAENGFENRTIIISSARLEPKNKFDLILKSIPGIIQEKPDLLWFVIGGGGDEERLKSLAVENNVENYLVFVGAVYDEEKLAPYFLSSLLFIHPAAIGLSMMHAFGYGLPVIVHGESHLHGPEYAAFADGFTGRNFSDNDTNSLTAVIIKLLSAYDEREQIRMNVQKIVREQYNVDVMVERFVEIADFATKG